MDLKRKKHTFRYLGQVVDAINILMAIVIVISAVLLAINVKEYMILFPVVFTSSAIMNIALGVKNYKRKKVSSSILSWIMGAVMLGLAIFSLVVVLS